MSTAFETAFLVLMLWLGLIGIVVGAIEDSRQRRADDDRTPINKKGTGHET